MSSRIASRVLARSLRPAARVSAPVGRRCASTSPSYAAKQSSDMPWMIGSALVFGPLMAYLLTNPAKGKAKHAAEHPHAKQGVSEIPAQSQQDPANAAKDSTEQTEESPSDSEVESSAAKATEADSPKDAYAAEEAGSSAESDDGKVHGAPALTDSEGNTASAEEVNDSMKQAFKSNIPEDAERAEAHDAKYAEGTPSQTEEAQNKPDQKEKPGRPHTGTFQDDSDNGPTDLGDARKSAKSQEAPKQASQD